MLHLDKACGRAKVVRKRLEIETDNPLIAKLPEIVYLDIKTRVRDTGFELIALTQVESQIAASYEVTNT